MSREGTFQFLRGGALAGACLWLLSCGEVQLRSICALDDDCPDDGRCVAGRCVAPGPSAAPRDSGEPLPACEVTCGGQCCGDDEACVDGVCVLHCESGVWCGSVLALQCCDEGFTCAKGVCTPPPEPEPACDGGVWDPELQLCVAPTPTAACERETGWFQPEVLWRAQHDDSFDQVLATPIVVDVNADGISDVVAPFFSTKLGHDGPAVLRALSGVDGAELWRFGPAEDGLSGIAQLAAGALYVPQGVVVIGIDRDGRLNAFDGKTGVRLWKSRDKSGGAEFCDVGWGAPSLVDLEGDARAEIVCGFAVFDSNGVLEWRSGIASGPLGSITVVADLNLDGKLDITDGTRALRHDGALLWEADAFVGGLPAVADFISANGDLSPDGWPEVVVTRYGQLELRDGLSGAHLAAPIQLPTWDGYACYPHASSPGVGGAPAVADVDGDGIPEVVVSSGECLAALALRKSSVYFEWYMLWGMKAIDESSSTTGASLFDFDADGWFDVAHADETEFRLVNGSHGVPKYTAEHCSGTVYENPVIADVDGDGSANVVIASNTVGRNQLGCAPMTLPGITVLRERRSRWSNARSVWNQHAYQATTVCDGADLVCASLGEEWGAHGVIPMDTPRAWAFVPDHATFPYNGARANTSGPWRPRGGANAVISHVVVGNDSCPTGLALKVRVENRGEVPLRAGTELRVTDATRGATLPVAGRTSRALAPGAAEVVLLRLEGGRYDDLVAQVDADDRTAECDETDNGFEFSAACP